MVMGSSFRMRAAGATRGRTRNCGPRVASGQRPGQEADSGWPIEPRAARPGDHRVMGEVRELEPVRGALSRAFDLARMDLHLDAILGPIGSVGARQVLVEDYRGIPRCSSKHLVEVHASVSVGWTPIVLLFMHIALLALAEIVAESREVFPEPISW